VTAGKAFGGIAASDIGGDVFVSGGDVTVA
jgi:hypothetical protein